jgi:hypothetical protein
MLNDKHFKVLVLLLDFRFLIIRHEISGFCCFGGGVKNKLELYQFLFEKGNNKQLIRLTLVDFNFKELIYLDFDSQVAFYVGFVGEISAEETNPRGISHEEELVLLSLFWSAKQFVHAEQFAQLFRIELNDARLIFSVFRQNNNIIFAPFTGKRIISRYFFNVSCDA